MPMTGSPEALLALTAYAAWTMLLVLSVASVRVHKSLSEGIEDAGTSLRDVEHHWRLHRAHMNAIENLPIFATVVLTAWAAGAVDTQFSHLAVIVVAARATQSLIHIASASRQAISLRFVAFGIQIVCQFWMIWLILAAAGVFVAKA